MKKWLALFKHQIVLFQNLEKYPILELKRLEVLAQVCEWEEMGTQRSHASLLLLSGRGEPWPLLRLGWEAGDNQLPQNCEVTR